MTGDVIRIAGGGVSGLSAAIGLARRGHRVEVFEKNADSGMVRHTEWDAIENWTTQADLLTMLGEWGVAPSFEYRPLREFEAYDANGVRYPFITRAPFCYLVLRGRSHGSLEQALKSQVLEHGVNIHYGQSCTRDEVDIWAVGSRSRGFGLQVGITFRTTHPDVVMVIISTSAAPKAYAYLVIVDGFGTLAVVLTRDFKNARTYLERSLELFRKARTFDIKEEHFTSGWAGAVEPFWEHQTRPLAVGEAAGFQDYLWGFGIRNALFSGHLAARALDEGIEYEALVSREIRPLVRSSMINRMFYDYAGDRAYSRLLKWFSSTSDLQKLTRQWYRGLTFRHLLWPIVKRRYDINRIQRPQPLA